MRQHLLEVFCLAKTKLSSVKPCSLQLGYVDVFEIPPRGRKGGLVVARRKGVILDVVYSNNHFVNLDLNSDPQGHPWLLTFVYGPTLWNEKAVFWYDLECCRNVFAGPWLCFGDFNSIFHQIISGVVGLLVPLLSRVP